MSRFWSPFVHNLVPYVPGEQPKLERLVKLNTNENPYGPSPNALKAIRAATDSNLRLYPDPDSSALKQAIASYYQVEKTQVFVGNSSDEVLAHIFLGFFKNSKPVLFPDISYSFYKVYCGLYQLDYQAIPLAADFSIDLSVYPSTPDAGSNGNGGIIFPNPNAPTGIPLALAEIETLLKRNTESLVVVDEAYVDFGADTAIALVDRYPNLLVTQTLSKSRSLAGMRVGFAIGQAALIEGLERIKNSFNSYPLDRLAIVGAVAAFEDEGYFRECCDKVISSREKMRVDLEARGFEILPSAANFLFARHPSHNGADLAAALRRHGVIVRHFTQPERISNFLRISIGTPEQNQALSQALDAEL